MHEFEGVSYGTLTVIEDEEESPYMVRRLGSRPPPTNGMVW